MESNEYVVISRKEFEDLMYRYSKIANDQLYKGLSTFLHSYEESFKELFEEVDYIKNLLKSEDNPLITFKDMGESDKKQISKVLTQAIREND